MPLHSELSRYGLKGDPERFQVKGHGAGFNFIAHEKPATDLVGMVISFCNPAVIGCQKSTDFCHDAHPVRAGNDQTISMLHETTSLLNQNCAIIRLCSLAR